MSDEDQSQERRDRDVQRRQTELLEEILKSIDRLANELRKERAQRNVSAA